MPKNENEQFLLQYLNMMLDVHRRNHAALCDPDMPFLGPIDLLLKKGRFFPPTPLPTNIQPMPKKMCFSNALQLASRRKDLTYVEGYGIAMIPTSHAWCVDRDGNVVDPTWTPPINGIAYLGIPFRTDYVKKTIRRSDSWSVLFDWPSDYPLCTGEHSLEEAVPEEWLNALA